MLGVAKSLFEIWNNTGVLYCHWKSNEHLAEGLDGLTDLDVFVVEDHKKKAEDGLKSAKYIKFKPQKSAIYKDVDEWIGFDYDTGKLVHIHLHYKIITGTKFVKQYEFPIEQRIIETRALHYKEPIYVISPEIEIIVLYSRIVLKAKDYKNIIIKKDDIKEILYLKELLDKTILKDECERIFLEKGAKIFDLILKEELTEDEWRKIYILVRSWLKKNMRCSDFTTLIRHKYFRYRAILQEIMRKKFNKYPIRKKTMYDGGRSVCFLGADGSGKSTVSCEIEKWLTWKIEASRFYLGSGDHYNSFVKMILGKINRKFRKAKGSEEKIHASSSSFEAQTKKVARKESLFKRCGKLLYSFLMVVYLKQVAVRSYKEIKKAQKYIKNGAIAIYDRFPQNQFKGMYDGAKIRVRAKRLGVFTKFFAQREERAICLCQKYQPNLIFKLCLPAEESVRRKPDHTIEEIRPKAEMTEKLKFENSKVVTIDATQPYEEEILQIKRIIWSELLNDN